MRASNDVPSGHGESTLPATIVSSALLAVLIGSTSTSPPSVFKPVSSPTFESPPLNLQSFLSSMLAPRSLTPRPLQLDDAPARELRAIRIPSADALPAWI